VRVWRLDSDSFLELRWRIIEPPIGSFTA
jgi:hypothetical protein